MSTHDMNIANQAFPAFRADLNNALGALVSNSSSATEPTTTFAHQWWIDTSASPSVVKIRNADDDAWVTIGTIDETTDTFTPSGITADKITEGNSSVEVVDSGTGYVTIVVDGSEQMRISASGAITTPNGLNFDSNTFVIDAANNRVGIGTTSTYGTNSKLSVSGSATAADTGIVLSDGSTTTIGLALATPSTGGVSYIFGNNNLAFGANGSERARITSDGYLRMASGSGGIQFNGDTAAANALDDYEEGTWTATVEGSSTAGTASYTVQTMAYVKIGNAVFINGYVTYSGATGTGNLRLAGLPFTTNATYYSSLTFALNDIVLTAGNYGLIAQTVLNNTKINFYQGPTGGGSLTAVPMDSAGDIYIGGVYFI